MSSNIWNPIFLRNIPVKHKLLKAWCDYQLLILMGNNNLNVYK